MYALRELKHRKKTFIPVICIAAGVMILMTNILVYMQSRYTTDLAYYKTDTHLIMPNIKPDEADLMETLEYVDSVDRTADGSGYICYVKLKDEYLTDFRKYADCGVRIMHDLRLTNREPYDNYLSRVERYGYTDNSFIGGGLFNYMYIDLMTEPPVFTPPMLTLILLSFLTHLAAVWLVFSMKVRRGRDEFASMRAMGASMKELRQINQIEAVGITAVMFLPSLAISLGSVKLVCVLSQNLYPDFGMNSLLTFDAPWSMIIVSFLAYILAAYTAVFIVTRHLKANTITELTLGTDQKIPFVERSSMKLINSSDFRPYSRIERKRTFKNNLPIQILFSMLILFPMLIAGPVSEMVASLALSSSPFSTVYSFESSMKTETRISVPQSLVEHVLSLDGIVGAGHSAMTSVLPHSVHVSGIPDEYQGFPLTSNFSLCSELFDSAENVPAIGTCFAPAELFEVGDKITLGSGKNAYSLTVSEVREGLFSDWTTAPYKRYNITILISAETLADFMGWDEPRYQFVTFSCEKGRELELIPQIEACAGYKLGYVNDHERQLRQMSEMEFTGSAVYIERHISNLYSMFVFTFLLAETLYLLICASSVIASTTAYEVSGRTKEFSVLRALGMHSGDIHKLSAVKQLLGIVLMITLTFVFLVLISLWNDSTVRDSVADRLLRENTYDGIFSGIVRFFIPIVHFAKYYLPVTLMALLGYGSCAFTASWKTVGAMLRKPVAECVKNKE